MIQSRTQTLPPHTHTFWGAPRSIEIQPCAQRSSHVLFSISRIPGCLLKSDNSDKYWGNVGDGCGRGCFWMCIDQVRFCQWVCLKIQYGKLPLLTWFNFLIINLEYEFVWASFWREPTSIHNLSFRSTDLIYYPSATIHVDCPVHGLLLLFIFLYAVRHNCTWWVWLYWGSFGTKDRSLFALSKTPVYLYEDVFKQRLPLSWQKSSTTLIY